MNAREQKKADNHQRKAVLRAREAMKKLRPEEIAIPQVKPEIVKLAEEFVTLKAQIKVEHDEIKEREASITASHINHDMTIKYNNKKIAAATARLRVLEAQFTNVVRLLQPELDTERHCNGCSERLTATEVGQLNKYNPSWV